MIADLDILSTSPVSRIQTERGGGYIAVVTDLPDWVSNGETSAEALANVHDAIEA